MREIYYNYKVYVNGLYYLLRDQITSMQTVIMIIITW